MDKVLGIVVATRQYRPRIGPEPIKIKTGPNHEAHDSGLVPSVPEAETHHRKCIKKIILDLMNPKKANLPTTHSSHPHIKVAEKLPYLTPHPPSNPLKLSRYPSIY